MKKALFFLLILVSTLAIAHEFWLSPSDFFSKLGDKIKLTAFVGENYEGEHWGGGDRRIELLKVRTAKKWLPLPVNQNDSLVQIPDYEVKDNGTHVFTLTTNSSYIELEPDKFEAYLKEDGLNNVLEFRQKTTKARKMVENYTAAVPKVWYK